MAASTGAAVCRLDDLSGWVELWPDAVHPTAVGQLAIADRAARALGAAVRPSDLADAPSGRRTRLRHAPDVRSRGDPGTCQGADRAAIGAGGGSSGVGVGPTTGGTCSPRPAPSNGCPAAFERLARLAASALGARAGGVTLLRDGVLGVAGGHELPPGGGPTEECHRIVATREVVVVGNAYAGVPIRRADGSVIGTLCVMDRDRDWTPTDVSVLEDVAASVVAELELSEAAAAARREQRIGAAVLDVATDCLIQIDPEGRILSWSPSAERTFGWDPATAVGRSLIDLMAPRGPRRRVPDGPRRRRPRGQGADPARRGRVDASRRSPRCRSRSR